MQQNRPKIIILSDLWGKEKSQWIAAYTSVLDTYFDFKYYDICTLGEIDTQEYTEEKLHQQFVAGGIERAVKNLVKSEKGPVNVLAFSTGGTIAWKAGLFGLKIQNLFAISSTRLRYETQKPEGFITLIYGKNDTYIPDVNWFEKTNVLTHIYPNEAHEMYKKREIAGLVCKMVFDKLKS